jgi:hypothetical protein
VGQLGFSDLTTGSEFVCLYHYAYQSECATIGQALVFSPLMQAGWADASRVEGIPFETALAEPAILFARRPAAERAADARRFRRAGLLLFFKLAIQDNR